MREHKFVPKPKGRYHTEIIKSEYKEGDGETPDALDIYWMSDGPSREDIAEFIEQEYPKLKKRHIKFIYNGPSFWLSDYNMGNPKGCFSVLTLFFE